MMYNENAFPFTEQRDRKEAGISPRGENTHGDTDLRLPPVLPQSIQSVVALPSDQTTGFQARRCRDFDGGLPVAIHFKVKRNKLSLFRTVIFSFF